MYDGCFPKHVVSGIFLNVQWVRLIYISENSLLYLVGAHLCCNSSVESERQERWWLIIWCYQPLPNENNLHLLLIIPLISGCPGAAVSIDIFSASCSSKISPLSDSAIFLHKYQWSMTIIWAAGLLLLDINAITEKYQHSLKWRQGVLLTWSIHGAVGAQHYVPIISWIWTNSWIKTKCFFFFFVFCITDVFFCCVCVSLALLLVSSSNER